MADESSVNDVFRFIVLRPQREARETGAIALARDTELVKRLSPERTVAGRARIANQALADTAIHGIGDVTLGEKLTDAIARLGANEEPSVADLRAEVPELGAFRSSGEYDRERDALSDVLLASYFATEGFPPDLGELQDVYRAYHLADDEDGPLHEFLARPLLAPPMPRAGEAGGTAPGIRAESRPDPQAAYELSAGIEELSALDRPSALVQPTGEGRLPQKGTAFALTEAARRNVSGTTKRLLAARGIDLSTTPLDVAVTTLADEASRVPPLTWPGKPIEVQSGVTLPPPPRHRLVRPAGVADLLVVKQQIKRYEAGEIAHVENVLAHEKKSRAHRRLDRSEETFVTETEVTRTQETELETADRFELNRETAKTIKADQKTGFGLSLSGKYGPSVEFTSKFEQNTSTATEEATKNSSRYARDVVSRSLERVTERVREVRTRTVIRETEETNLHELDNETAEHSSGIYQFLDKVYETQIFNYGIRQMFDFMVPEPASFLWYVEANPSLDVDLPPAPPKLELVAPDASHINEWNALGLAAAYGATDVEHPPPVYKLLTANVKHGEDNADEEGQPHSGQRAELQIPSGYRPLRARIRGLAFTDNNPVIAVAIGSRKVVWRPAAGDRIPVSEGQLAHEPELALTLDADPYEMEGEGKLGVSVLAWETATYSVEVVVVVRRTSEELDRWRVAMYRKIRAAYDDRVREHEQKVAELKAEAEARAERENRLPFGAPPAINRRTIQTELKKHCLSTITEQRYDAFDATKDGAPPFFDFLEAAAEGSYIRFFEQAFEWDQMQYVFYPYFWSRKTTWVDRFVRQDVDPEFLEFLRAGSARVVVPVRPGFEVAVTHFVETGKLWGGEGEPPQINDPLYVSIIDELRERTGAPEGEKAVGDPWEARVPTALVLVRGTDDLPSWERTSPDAWEWRPAEAE